MDINYLEYFDEYINYDCIGEPVYVPKRYLHDMRNLIER